MNFYIGVLGLVFAIRDERDVVKMSWDLEPRASEAIATDIFRQMQWPELNMQKKQGVTTSVLGFLYDPIEYKQRNIPRIHRDITFAMLERKPNDSVAPPPFPVKITQHEGVKAYLRVLPVFFYGQTRLLRRLFQQKLNPEFVLGVIRENLDFSETTEILAYNNVVGHDEVDDWINNTMAMLRKRRAD